eukprot:CAMPEP_0183362558 /NCGR_PEP_ID=MMETSP0164_2-20130417/70108_1 /TAXON_ID=221442 /ORGANISM="Coccolithus pelagicus ssp braarudi, Strain PLY182g" /LENGTH=58 /DNA_ID=CAMNT_0025537453 /DNA_START=29 /DNA_END=202 /DNA_ORIENTATION=+
MAAFLIRECKANVNAEDRWGFTPLQDALRANKMEVVDLLRKHGAHNGSAPYADIFNAA